MSTSHCLHVIGLKIIILCIIGAKFQTPSIPLSPGGHFSSKPLPGNHWVRKYGFVTNVLVKKVLKYFVDRQTRQTDRSITRNPAHLGFNILQLSPSDKATLFAKKLWPHYRGGLWQEGEVNAFIVVATKHSGHIRGWPLLRVATKGGITVSLYIHCICR